jgi:hypothetical protein
MSVSWTNKTFHLRGLEVINGEVSLNDNPLKFGDWSFETSDDSSELIIRNNNTIHAKIVYNNDLSNINKNRFFIIDPVNIKDCIGFLVSNADRFFNMDLTQSPNYNLAQPMIKLSNESHDKSVLGVIIDCEDNSREYINGSFKTIYKQDDNINRVILSMSGIGSVWVTDMNGLFENGDFITTSTITGYGMKQDNSNICYNHTWAKITHNCNFEPEIKVLQQPVDFNKSGPVFKPCINIDGDLITDYEYRMKYINKKGEKSDSHDFQKEFTSLLNNELSKLNKSSLDDNEKDIIELVLKNPNRTIFRACLVGYVK